MDKKVRSAGAARGAPGQHHERFSEDFAGALAHCVQRIAPLEGERALDVAFGTGWTARLSADYRSSRSRYSDKNVFWFPSDTDSTNEQQPGCLQPFATVLGMAIQTERITI